MTSKVISGKSVICAALLTSAFGCTTRYDHVKHYYAGSRVSHCRKLADLKSDSANETLSWISELLKSVDAGLNRKNYVPSNYREEDLNRAKDKAVDLGGDTVLLVSDTEFEIYDCGQSKNRK